VSEDRRRWDRPVVLEHHDEVARSLGLLEGAHQAMGFVWGGDGFVGVVTAEDLRFAIDWLGPTASVDDAMTFSVIEIGRDADLAAATEAFSDGLRRWVGTHGRPGQRRSGP
jgi:CBS domain-containing protein